MSSKLIPFSERPIGLYLQDSMFMVKPLTEILYLYSLPINSNKIKLHTKIKFTFHNSDLHTLNLIEVYLVQ